MPSLLMEFKGLARAFVATIGVLGAGWLSWEAVGDANVLRLASEAPGTHGEHESLVQGLEWARGALPDDDRVLRALARTHLAAAASGADAAQHRDAAIEALQAAARAAPLDARLEYALAWEHYRGGDLSAAERNFRRALSKDPINAEHLYGLGRLRERQDRVEEASALYRRAMALRPHAKFVARIEYLNLAAPEGDEP